jgi:hypothetical protein
VPEPDRSCTRRGYLRASGALLGVSRRRSVTCLILPGKSIRQFRKLAEALQARSRWRGSSAGRRNKMARRQALCSKPRDGPSPHASVSLVRQCAAIAPHPVVRSTGATIMTLA